MHNKIPQKKIKQMKVIIQIPTDKSLKISYKQALKLNYQMFTLKKFTNKLNKDELNIENYKYIVRKVKI